MASALGSPRPGQCDCRDSGALFPLSPASPRLPSRCSETWLPAPRPLLSLPRAPSPLPRAPGPPPFSPCRSRARAGGGPRSAQSAAPAPWCPRVSLTERPGGFCVRGLHPALGAPEREVADSSAPAACHRSPPGTERGLSEGPFGPRQFGLLVQCGGHCF